jgi:hypothetical protein
VFPAKKDSAELNAALVNAIQNKSGGDILVNLIKEGAEVKLMM